MTKREALEELTKAWNFYRVLPPEQEKLMKNNFYALHEIYKQYVEAAHSVEFLLQRLSENEDLG